MMKFDDNMFIPWRFFSANMLRIDPETNPAGCFSSPGKRSLFITRRLEGFPSLNDVILQQDRGYSHPLKEQLNLQIKRHVTFI